MAKTKLSQPDVKLKDTLIWSRKAVSCVFALLLYSWGSIFSTLCSVNWGMPLVVTLQRKERLFIPRILVLGIFISYADAFSTRFLLTVYHFLSTRVTCPRLERICHREKTLFHVRKCCSLCTFGKSRSILWGGKEQEVRRICSRKAVYIFYSIILQYKILPHTWEQKLSRFQSLITFHIYVCSSSTFAYFVQRNKLFLLYIQRPACWARCLPCLSFIEDVWYDLKKPQPHIALKEVASSQLSNKHSPLFH